MENNLNFRDLQHYLVPPDNIKGGWDTRLEEYKDLGLSVGLPPNIIPKGNLAQQYASLLMESLYNDEIGGINSLIAPALRYTAGKSVLVHYSETINDIRFYINSTLNVFLQTNDINYIVSNQAIEPNTELITFQNEFIAKYVFSHTDIFSDIQVKMLPLNEQTVDFSIQKPTRAFSTNVAVIDINDSEIEQIMQRHRPHITSFSKGTGGVVFNVDSPSYTQILINFLQMEHHQASQLIFPGPQPCPHPIYLNSNQITYLNYKLTLSQALSPTGFVPPISQVIDREDIPIFPYKILYIYNAIDSESLRDPKLEQNINRDFSTFFARFGTYTFSGFIKKTIGISAIYVVKYSRSEYAYEALKNCAGMRYMGKILICQLRENDL